ncbi:hypothetical protein MMC14_001602 [Varicellaria rhodocarpa]|nr:hypothetical protein [Varicellaria rhodocarpa]
MEDLVLPGKFEQFKPQWRCEACQTHGGPRTASTTINVHSGESEGQPSQPPHLIESFNESSAPAKDNKSNHTQKKLCCPFHSLSCFQTLDSFQDWLKHTLVHFGEVGPPPSVPCGSCDKTFSRSSTLESWKDYMTHLTDHQREDDETVKSSLHLDLYKYMYEKSLITSSIYKDLYKDPQTLLADLARRPPHSNHLLTGRLDELRTPPTFNKVNHVSPGLSTPNSGGLFPNLQKSAMLNSSRKRRLSSDGKERARSARKQGAACEDCRKKKKRCIHLLDGEIGDKESQDLVYQYSSPVVGGVRIKEANEMSDEEPLIGIRKFQSFGMTL